MFMQFEWDGGKGPYRVMNYDFSVSSESGDTALGNCLPGVITLTVQIPAEPNPGAEFFAFAQEQHDTAKEKGKGKVTVFPGEKTAKESLQEIAFSNGWITSLSMNVSDRDDKFTLTCKIASSSVTFSGTEFLHHRRIEHFEK
jgi:hypothetical protein